MNGRTALGALLMAALGICLGYGGVVMRQPNASAPARDSSPIEQTIMIGRHFALVYLGSPRCGAANRPEMPGLMAEAVRQVRQHGVTLGIPVVTFGVATSGGIDEGLAHLRRIGTFDQFVVESAGLNLGIARHLYGVRTLSLSTPQVVVIGRILDSEGRVTKEQVLARRTGVLEIREWVAASAPLAALDQFAAPDTTAASTISR